ncbi:Oxysterol-binding protein-related protein 6 [Plecturocebus cupreus]
MPVSNSRPQVICPPQPPKVLGLQANSLPATCTTGQSKVAAWLQDSEEMDRCAEGAGFHHVGQAGLELLTSDDPLASASQSAGIPGVSHRPSLVFLTEGPPAKGQFSTTRRRQRLAAAVATTARWLTPVIPAFWEAEVGRSQGQEFETSLANMVKPRLY